MDITSNFIEIVDRYLELSNVYHQKILDSSDEMKKLEDVSHRYQRLLASLQNVNVDEKPINITICQPSDAKGRVMVPTQEFVQQTELQQKIVLDRLENIPYYTPTPRNFPKLLKLLKLTPEQYLGSFPTVNYAWDFLAQMASLTVLPDNKTLYARDIIHMHAVELQIHMVKIITQLKLASSTSQINLARGNLSVSDIRNNESSIDTLVAKLIELTVPNDSDKLFDEFMSLIPDMPVNVFCEKEDVLDYLRQTNKSLHENFAKYDIANVQVICEKLVVFGLTALYTAWCQVATRKSSDPGTLRRSITLCTRILLDEKRWKVCRDFSNACLLLLKKLDKTNGLEQHYPMLTLNFYFSSIKCGTKAEIERIQEQIRQFDTTMLGLDSRYEFLKKILLREFDAAKTLLEPLLENKQFSVQEVREWPMLEDFRKSHQGEETLKSHE